MANDASPMANDASPMANEVFADGEEMKNEEKIIKISGVPSEKQKEFFSSRAKYTAYGGARGGGKSWALRRKLIALSLRYPGIKCLIVRRSYPELIANHVRPMLEEYSDILTYKESEKCFFLAGGSTIKLGFCSSERDTLRYQGQEYDIIAIDEATQLHEYQFRILSACLRGTGDYPRRMYLTCNPGGVGHSWVKRLFVDRVYREGEDPSDYRFIRSLVYDNPALMRGSPDYVKQLEALPEKLRRAWLEGRWDIFEGQFFPEFDESVHVVTNVPSGLCYYAAFDYGFDMLAALIIGFDASGNIYVVDEFCRPGLILSDAAKELAELCSGREVMYAVCSPDLWNRRQDSGKSGFEIMSEVEGLPPLVRADNRRVAGWRVLREYLGARENGAFLRISHKCTELIRSLPALLCDKNIPDDASSEPHEITHAPEALRYAVMSRAALPSEGRPDFAFPVCGGLEYDRDDIF